MFELFTTIIGSHAWNMQREDSDIDYATVYLANSKDILLGKKIRGKQIQDEKKDITYYELGHFISNLVKGNINFIWSVMSPLVVGEYRSSLRELREITSTNLAKNCYNSINGLAKHNIYHFLECADKKTQLYEKKLNVIGRTLLFGINLFVWHKAMFKATNITNIEEIYELKERLDRVYKSSTLPDILDVTPFYNYLIKYRIKKLKIDKLI